jgi:glycine oxidase
MMKTCDVAIIGAGIIGASCANALAEEGLRVVLFDRQTPGCEASWAAGGMLSPAPYLPDDEQLAPLANESLRLYPEFVRAIESASQKRVNYRGSGAIEVFYGAEGAVERDRYVASCRALKIEAESITATEARRLEPAIASNVRAASRFASEGTVEPRALMDAVLESARVRKVDIRANCAVQSLVIERERCVGVIAEGERIATNRVVIAAGCYSQEILATDSESGRRLATLFPTRPVRGQMIALLPRDASLGQPLRSSRGYLVPRANGWIVAGSTLEEAGFEKRTTAEGLRKIRSAAIEMVPGLAGAEIVESWCGLRPGTPDGLPILGPTDIEGVIAATGHFRNGILLAPVTAQLVKDWIGGEPQLPVAAYSPLRFARAAVQSHSAS